MTRAIIALAAALLVAGSAAVYALAGHQPRSVASITGCLTSTAKLVKLKVGDVPKQPCAGQTEVHLSGGDITAVTPIPGGGLTGGGTNGEALLGLGSQACPAGAVVTGIDTTGRLVCGRSIVSANGLYRVDVSDTEVQIKAGQDTLTLSEEGVLFEIFGINFFQVRTRNGSIGLENVGANSKLHLSSNASLTSDGTVVLSGELIGLVGFCQNVARKGDAVVVNPQNGVGSIVSGSAKVFAC